MTIAFSPSHIGSYGTGSHSAPRRGTVVLHSALAVALIAVAYHHSLSGLFDYLSSDTPLAYVSFVPVLALGLAFVKARPRTDEPRLPDRQFDWIIGVPFLAAALLVAVLLPGRLSYSFWTNRLDLLGLPLFVAGVVALLFGSRVLYRIRLPIAFLLLAWPFPYERLMADVLSLSSSVALWGVGKGLPIVGGAQLVQDSIFRVGDGAGQFTVNVAPTCAGANSAVGFLLVGGAAVSLLTGRRLRKLAWLAFGVALMLALNVGRLLLLFWAGDRYGEEVMMRWLHPYAGLAIFVLGCLVTIALLPRFGIRLGPAAGREPVGAVGGQEPDPTAGSPRPAFTKLRGTRTAIVVVLLLAAFLGSRNAQLVRFESFGPTKASAAIASGLQGIEVAGWSGTMYEDVRWAKQFFGSTSDWWRFVYESEATAGGPRRSMFVDVVNVADISKFSTYGLEACYRFHGYRIVDSHRTDVGTAAKAQAITYLNTETHRIWSVVAWVTPVDSQAGRRYERVALLASVDAVGQWRPKAEAASSGLVSFARSFVASAADVAAPDTGPTLS